MQNYINRILKKEKNLLPLTITQRLYIEKQLPKTTINEKKEYGKGALIRLTAGKSVNLVEIDLKSLKKLFHLGNEQYK